MKRRTNRILSILLVVLSLALLAGAGFLLVQVLPQKAPQEVTSLETNSVFEKEDAVVEPEREQAYEGEIPPAAETQPEPDTQPSDAQPEQTEPSDTGLISAEADKRARTTLASMTADEKIWQLFYATPELLTGVETATRAGDSTKQALEEKPVGGIIYFAKNLESRAQTQEMLHNHESLHENPPVPRNRRGGRHRQPRRLEPRHGRAGISLGAVSWRAGRSGGRLSGGPGHRRHAARHRLQHGLCARGRRILGGFGSHRFALIRNGPAALRVFGLHHDAEPLGRGDRPLPQALPRLRKRHYRRSLRHLHPDQNAKGARGL